MTTMQRLLSPRFVTIAAVWALLMGVSPGRALAMPSESISVLQIPSAAREAQIEKIMSVFSHPGAQLHLRMAGISRAKLREDLSRLDDAQLAVVAQKADSVKAAGELGLIIALLVVAILVVILIMLLNKDIQIKDKNKS